MTREEAKANQDRLEAEGYYLGFWYGTWCDKCCGVYPIIRILIGPEDLCRYECEVCGKRTKAVSMPWIARDLWNAGEFLQEQIRMF